MKRWGIGTVFTNAFKLVTQMGQSDGETAYSLSKLIMQSLNSYNDAFFFTLYILALIIIAAVGPAYLKTKFKVEWLGSEFCKMVQPFACPADHAERAWKY